MKRFFITAVIACAALSMSAATKDTLVVNNGDITNWIESESTNAKGKKVMKYYVIYKGELVATNKASFERQKLVKKHGAKLKAIAIGTKDKTGFVAKTVVVK